MGDALGAPIEFTRKLRTLQQRYGSGGLDRMITNRRGWGRVSSIEAGMVTDDTAMLATTMEAIIQNPDQSNHEHLMHLCWQAYLRWGAVQRDGTGLNAFFDPAITWPDRARTFWFTCGAGRGTMATLLTGEMGTLDKPVHYDTIIQNIKTTGPNQGCGGMMRAAPFAFLPVEDNTVFDLARRNTAITHGGDVAQIAAGIVALITRRMTLGDTPVMATDAALQHIKDIESPGAQKCKLAITTATTMAQTAAPDMATIDSLPKVIEEWNPFLAAPVLSQTIYALLCHAQFTGDATERFRKTLALAVTHTGDSDSVGSITGNWLGTQMHIDQLPADWLASMRLAPDLRELCADFIRVAYGQPIDTA